jgi:hypothetical protein
METLMTKPQLWMHLSVAFLLSTVPALSHELQTVAPSNMECGGQYECRQDLPLTPQEASTSIGYPQAAASHAQARK